ncbi:hypothetical protein ILUMI_23023 [Ignelater luminosus]|uniref:Probable prefoldin subunit 6 n=1 Tax=Ignelater luminosus TaxID=2038154 RepID=A0A8K0FX46_IGNLU|nr:hypothetical protein ILUMI_23023 [Ignelater luminosus]
MEDAQKKLENELSSFKNTQKEFQKAVATRQQLDAQLNENQIVKEELDRLPADRKVYKAIGPALIKTEIVEAKQNVTKRIDYINNEIKRSDDLIVSLEKKQDSHREALQRLQQQYQQAKMKAAMKA